MMTNETKQVKKIILPITGMTCASCVTTIEKALQDIDGVISANVNLASEKATVEYDIGKVGMADFRKAVAAGILYFVFGQSGVPLALQFFLGNYSFLNPTLAALAMASSSITVITNSLRLKGFKPAKLTD